MLIFADKSNNIYEKATRPRKVSNRKQIKRIRKRLTN